MVFHWSLRDIKSQVSMTLLSILADLKNLIVWIFATRLVISKTSNPCINPFVIVPRAPITIGINVTLIFHSFFFTYQARSRELIFFSVLFNFILQLAKAANSASSFVWLITLRSNHHHHHVVPLARMSLILSCHFSLSFIASGRSSGLSDLTDKMKRSFFQAAVVSILL